MPLRLSSTIRLPRPTTALHHPLKKRRFHASAPSHATAPDPYTVLGVKKDASAAEIKKKYFQLAKQYHPDTNKDPTAKDRFVEIQNAYSILSDDKKRTAYDQFGHAAEQQGFPQDSDFFHQFSGQGFAFKPSDIFEQVFGGGFGGASRRQSGPVVGEDIETQIHLTFLEAAKGVRKPVHIEPVVDCPTCGGSGLKQGAKRATCVACKGTGYQTASNGFIQMMSTCNVCGGAGHSIPRGLGCQTCDEVGKIKVDKTVTVDIPAGIEDGNVFRVPGEGDVPVQGQGRPGDLLVRTVVAPSKDFRRKGKHLYADLRVPLQTALLGGKVRVPTLDGSVDFQVAAGSQQGEQFTLKGKGLKPSGSSAGDLHVKLEIRIPKDLTKRQREILQDFFDDLEGRTPTNAKTTPTSSSSSTSESSSSSGKGQNGQEEKPHGTDSAAEESWLSRARNKFRGVTGI